jgi:enamine deaminase RidA (YjgF/YER057c/UK114 family)
MDSNGKIVGRNDIRAQAVKAFENLEAMLKEAGATLDDVVKLNLYATRFEDYATIREVRKSFFPKDPPAATGVIVSSLVFKDLLVEVDAEAVVNES